VDEEFLRNVLRHCLHGVRATPSMAVNPAIGRGSVIFFHQCGARRGLTEQKFCSTLWKLSSTRRTFSTDTIVLIGGILINSQLRVELLNGLAVDLLSIINVIAGIYLTVSAMVIRSNQEVDFISRTLVSLAASRPMYFLKVKTSKLILTRIIYADPCGKLS
jgi:hypothetical protein